MTLSQRPLLNTSGGLTQPSRLVDDEIQTHSTPLQWVTGIHGTA